MDVLVVAAANAAHILHILHTQSIFNLGILLFMDIKWSFTFLKLSFLIKLAF